MRLPPPIRGIRKMARESLMKSVNEKWRRDAIQQRLEYLRGELHAERISYGELAELQSLVEHIAPDDVELLEAAGVPEQQPATQQPIDGWPTHSFTPSAKRADWCEHCGGYEWDHAPASQQPAGERRPWRYQSQMNGGYWLFDGRGPLGETYTEKDAALIVRAVNEREELLGLARMVVDWYEGRIYNGPKERGEIYDAATTALHRAEQEGG